MYKVVFNTFKLQCKEMLKQVIKRYSFYLLVLLAASISLLFAMSMIFEAMLKDMLIMILQEEDPMLLIQLKQSLLFASYLITFIVYVISVFFGLIKESQFLRMLKNYGIPVHARNFYSSLTRIFFLLDIVLLITTSILGMSMRHLDNKLLLWLIASIIFQVVISILFFEVVYLLMKRFLYPFGSNAVNILFFILVCIYSYLSYKVNDSWQFTKFMVNINSKAYLSLLILLLSFHWTHAFDYFRYDQKLSSLRGRVLPSTLTGKVMKELLRHKEARLNSILMITIVIGIGFLDKTLFYDPSVRGLILMMPVMMAIYSYSYFDSVIVLLRHSNRSLFNVISSHLLASVIIVTLHYLILFGLEKSLIKGMSPLYLLIMIFFLLLGKLFPLNDKKTLNSSIVIVLLILALVPGGFAFVEINKKLNLTEFELMLLGLGTVLALKGALIINVHHDLSRKR